MSTAIADSLRPCFEAFSVVVKISEDTDLAPQESIDSKAWEGELGRLRIWSANIAAHRKGRTSLDYRLRDDSQIQRQIVRLLSRLQSLLADVTRALVRVTPVESVVQETFDDDNEPEILRLYEFISNTIRRLFRMSMIIRKPAKSDFLRGGNREQVMGYLPIDIERIRLKYPRAPEFFVQRLGHAMIQRRNYLEYRRRQHAKFGQGLGDLGDDDPEDAVSDTNATGSRPETPTFDPVAPQDAFSATSFATSFLRGTHHNMPKRPEESAKGREFECPYCFYVIKTPNARSWVKHLFTDLRPYICHVENCSTSDELYDSWHMWLWHMQHRHPQQADGKCPFCISRYRGREWAKHVGKHLQDLALFALPPIDQTTQPDLSDHDDTDDDDDDDGDDDDDDSSDDDDSHFVPTFTPSHGPNFVDERVYMAKMQADRPSNRVNYNKLRCDIRRLGTDWRTLSDETGNHEQWVRSSLLN